MILIAVAVLLCIVAGLWTYARWDRGVLEKMGIPVVEHSNPFLGCARDLYTKVGGKFPPKVQGALVDSEIPRQHERQFGLRRKSYLGGGLLDTEWMKKYGPVFGVYEGRQPQVFICTPDLVRLVCVKDAEFFNAKRRLEFGDPIMNEMPDFQPLEKWRLLRSFATPAFTSAKIKLMNVPMKEATEDYVTDVKRKIKSGNGVINKLPIDTEIHSMLTDLISRCVFSIKISRDGGDQDNQFARIVKDMVTPPANLATPELLVWSHVFPFLKKMVPSIFKPEPVQQFVQIFKQMMNERRKSGQKMNDIVDMILDWYDKLDSPQFKEAKITELSLLCQALVFFFAAQDQVSTVVSAVIYHIQDPKLEKRIYEELDRVFAKHKGKIAHEQLNELVLMNSCINESLRLYAFFYRTERVCTKDWRNEEYNLSIKKGTTIIIPIWALNRNPEYNENPDKFDPDRFMPENKDKSNVYSSTSFGHGPRNCTGQRFATEVMPLILAYLLKDLKFVGRADSEIKFVPGGAFLAPHEPIYVDVVERR